MCQLLCLTQVGTPTNVDIQFAKLNFTKNDLKIEFEIYVDTAM